MVLKTSAHLFEEVFWGPTSDPLLGIKKLHENFQDGIAELEEILHFVSVRMMTEEYYANRLQELAVIRTLSSSRKVSSLSTGIVQDATSNSPLHQVLQSLRQEATIASATHRHMHDTLSRTHMSLTRFLDDHRRLSATRKDTIDAAARRYTALCADANSRKKEAAAKWDAAVVASRDRARVTDSTNAESSAQPPKAVLMFANLEFALDEFNSLVSDLELNVPKKDIKSIIGTYKSVVIGSHILKYLTTTSSKTKKPLQSIETASNFLTALINQGFLKSIAIRNSSKLSYAEQQYQWKKTALDNEPADTRTRREAERAEMEYRNAVDNAEEARVVLEAHCVEHMKTIQTALTERLTLTKTVLSSYIDSEHSCISPISQSVERLQILLEMFDAEKQVQTMAERDRTGNARLKPVGYFPSSSKIIVDPQILRSIVFGVPLETMATRDGRKVPDILRRGLRALEKGCIDVSNIGGKRGELAVWLEPNMYSPSVMSLRAGILKLGKPVSLSFLRAHKTGEVIGLLKLWLLQLPSSLCGDEIYDPLKLLYLSKSDEFAGMRAGSIKSLLTTLSPAAHHSLMALVSYWQYIDREARWDDLPDSSREAREMCLAELSQIMGPLILRPKVETLLTAHDKHAHRFLRDLLTHPIATVFFAASKSASSQSLQLEGEDLDAEDCSDSENGDLKRDTESGTKSFTSRIVLLDSVDMADDKKRNSLASDLAPSFMSRATKDPAEPLKETGAKSDEDLFLEEEGEGLDALDAEEISKLEAEMDQMLADGL
ncbi:hypothetical protein HDU84_002712 [Entophlyctis sp. JEL0112]|nr:hypothetical protein HDU84_002712 [Entophlyctis sp. JEL0112]